MGDKFHILKIPFHLLFKALASEWKKRDTEREDLMRRKVQEYEKIEAQLRVGDLLHAIFDKVPSALTPDYSIQKTLTDLEEREKKLTLGEEELVLQKRQLQGVHDAKLAEMQDASRRLKEDLEHKVLPSLMPLSLT